MRPQGPALLPAINLNSRRNYKDRAFSCSPQLPDGGQVASLTPENVGPRQGPALRSQGGDPSQAVPRGSSFLAPAASSHLPDPPAQQGP